MVFIAIIEGSLYSISINLVIKRPKYNNNNNNKVLAILITIDLLGNQIEGEISMTVENMTSLQLLNLSHNQFSGSILRQLRDIKLFESLDVS